MNKEESYKYGKSIVEGFENGLKAESTQRDIYLKAINTFGANQQIIKAIEKLGELSTALARYFDEHKIDMNNIHEEIADVEIMLNQLKLIFNEYEIEQYKILKIERPKGVVW